CPRLVTLGYLQGPSGENPMRTYALLLLAFAGSVCLPMNMNRTGGAAPLLSSPTHSNHKPITVRASRNNSPVVDLEDGIDLTPNYVGGARVEDLIKQGQAKPCALGSGDFDEDGVPDLIVGYRHANGGGLAIYRGNTDSIYPNSRAAQHR